MLWPLVTQTITFRIIVIIADYFILAVILQRPVEAGVITIIRHVLHTFIYWWHEVTWEHKYIDTALTLAKSRWNTIKKTVSFRIVSLITDLVLFWILTGDVWVSGVGAISIGITNTIFFYYHDRWWVGWRTKHNTERR